MHRAQKSNQSRRASNHEPIPRRSTRHPSVSFLPVSEPFSLQTVQVSMPPHALLSSHHPPSSIRLSPSAVSPDPPSPSHHCPPCHPVTLPPLLLAPAPRLRTMPLHARPPVPRAKRYAFRVSSSQPYLTNIIFNINIQSRKREQFSACGACRMRRCVRHSRSFHITTAAHPPPQCPLRSKGPPYF